MDLYAFIVQNPEKVPDDYYCRSRKKRLMKECRDRFGDLLEIVKGYRGEQRFKSKERPGNLGDLVRDALKRFTPWDSQCVLHHKVDPYEDEISGLNYEGADPDGVHGIEVNRIHALLHPQCFSNLTESFSLATPEERLSVPQFNLCDDSDEDTSNRSEPPDLGDDEQKRIEKFLQDNKNKRKKGGRGLLSVRVDGVEMARFNPAEEELTSFKTDDYAEMVEVYDEDETLLAVYLITEPEFGEEEQGQVAVIRLEAGQEIRFNINQLIGPHLEEPQLEIQVGYRETAPMRNLVKSGESLGARLKRFFSQGFMSAPAWATGLAVVLLAFLFLRPESPTVDPYEGTTRGLKYSNWGRSLAEIKKSM